MCNNSSSGYCFFKFSLYLASIYINSLYVLQFNVEHCFFFSKWNFEKTEVWNDVVIHRIWYTSTTRAIKREILWGKKKRPGILLHIFLTPVATQFVITLHKVVITTIRTIFLMHTRSLSLGITVQKLISFAYDSEFMTWTLFVLYAFKYIGSKKCSNRRKWGNYEGSWTASCSVRARPHAAYVYGLMRVGRRPHA